MQPLLVIMYSESYTTQELKKWRQLMKVQIEIFLPESLYKSEKSELRSKTQDNLDKTDVVPTWVEQVFYLYGFQLTII